MIMLRKAEALLVGVILALGRLGLVCGSSSQLVMNERFIMETASCEGLSCRKQIIGANETLGLGAYECSKGVTYGVPATRE